MDLFQKKRLSIYLLKQLLLNDTCVFGAFADHLDSEFGASPLGKADIRGGSAATTAPLETTNVDAAPLPDIYGDLYGNEGEGNVLLKTQVAQVRGSIKK